MAQLLSVGIMNVTCDLVDSRKSFSYRAALCSIFIPLLTAGATAILILISVFMDKDRHITSHFREIYYTCSLCLQVVSLLLGITSLFGSAKHGAKLILRKAALGIVASCGMALIIIVLSFGT